MAKPAQLQLLRHGKIICQAVFPFFVETWNWLVNSWNDVKGDFDTDPKNGAIQIDKTDPDHPVIRFRQDNIKQQVNLVAGDFTNIEFTNRDDGSIAVDVYYS